MTATPISTETSAAQSDHKTRRPQVLVLLHNDLRLHDNATLKKAIELIDAAQSKTDPPASPPHPPYPEVHNPTITEPVHPSGELIIAYAPLWMDKWRARRHQSDNSARLSHQVYDYEPLGQARQQFLQESLADLSISLQRLGNGLVYLARDAGGYDASDNQNQLPEDYVFASICELIEAHDVTDVCVSSTADFDQNQGYLALQAKYPSLHWHEQSTATLFEGHLALNTSKERLGGLSDDAMSTPSEIPRLARELPPIFSQFRKKVEAHHNLLTTEQDPVLIAEPSHLPPMPADMVRRQEWFFDLNYFLSDKEQIPSGFHGGESYALNHLESYFSSDAPSTYKTTRNALDEWSHSTKFSAWLANGSLSVNALLKRLRQYEREVIANESTYWIWFELLWREYFYWYAIKHQQKLFWLKGISDQPLPTNTIRGFDIKALEQWKNGTTAYPIVNACMHQLNASGYMSNRGRQLVASCLIHELGLDWRYGAAYFEQQLIDYDVGSNWGNWQYLAGVGADPRGCRQFNLDKQTQQHDPSARFISKWRG